MNDGRSRHDEGGDRKALGDVARDAMDHASMIVRDEVAIARLEVRRWIEHLKRDVAPRGVIAGAMGITGLLAGVFALLAVFLAIVAATDSVAWACAIYAVLFGVATIVLVGLYRRPARLQTAEDIERQFPAVKMEERRPEHALVKQETPPAHRVIVVEANREAMQGGEPLRR